MTKTAKDSAVSQAISSVRIDKYFPSKVLIGAWVDYLFFEPHIMFSQTFIEAKNLLIDAEQSSVVALINLGNHSLKDDIRTMFLERKTDAREYMSKLRGDGSPMNWLFLMDRYACASDKGSWAIYCEKENDVAVFAFRAGFPLSTCSAIQKLLGATSIRSVFDFLEDIQAFDFDKLTPDWKFTLLAEYGS